jgi:hypothetical protein
MDENTIAETYLRYHDRKREDDRWAVEEVDGLVARHPDAAWELTRILLSKAASDEVLAYVAAGPLEDLLKKHGPSIIDRVEEESRTNDRVRLALSGAWIRPGDPVFERWYALMSRYGFADGRRRPL